MARLITSAMHAAELSAVLSPAGKLVGKLGAGKIHINDIKIGANLIIDNDGVLSVDTADVVEQDNTKPVTSAAVHTEIGNIEVLLAAL